MLHPILEAHYAAGLPPLTPAQEAALDDLIIGLELIHCQPSASEVARALHRAEHPLPPIKAETTPVAPPPPPPRRPRPVRTVPPLLAPPPSGPHGERPRIIGRRFSSDFAEPQSFTIWDSL